VEFNDEQRLSIDVVVAYDRSAATLTVDGELDGISAPALQEAVDVNLTKAAPKVVELQMAAVTFLDSSGIRCLLTCRRLAIAADSHLVLLSPSPQVFSVLEITGLLDTFELSRDLVETRGYRWRRT